MTLFRYVFLLYKQEGKVEMESELRNDPLNLKDRNFSTLDFYSTYQVGFLSYSTYQVGFLNDKSFQSTRTT